MSFEIILHAIRRKIRHAFFLCADGSGRQASKRFVAYMQEKASRLGMGNSHFVNASGATMRSRSTAADLLRLALCASRRAEIEDVWSIRSAEISVSGPHRRNLTIVSQIDGAALRAMLPYHILGAKSGSWGETHKALVIRCSGTRGPITSCLMVDDAQCFKDIYSIAKELFDHVCGGEIGHDLQRFIDSGGSFAAEYDGIRIMRNEDDRHVPASTTKLLTVLCALDLLSPDDQITIHGMDIASGSGSTFYPGDIISVCDAIKGALVESSNTLAHALCRTAGERCM